MNHHAPSSDRSSSTPAPLSCRLVRAWSAWREDDAPVPASGWAARHVERCPDCAQHFTALRELETGLRREAREQAAAMAEVEVPLGMEDRIFAAVRPIVREQARVRRAPAWQRRLPAILGAAAAVALATVLWTGIGSSDTPDQNVAAADVEFSPEDMQQLTASVASFKDRVFSAPTTVPAEAPKDGLSAELQALRSDTSAALRFLERSFLPSDVSLSGRNAATEAKS
ncbi:hypothetical protein [Actomonas aquatica]|uniref:Zinc-finger domain-containing protein n=1 Tax=Actomonas aquatica TaxID=2866162 RepID=A0ABZ1C293_9BACT|nr:hypothetical protein [Opitutus sp. WL0086]WRQ85812.1 hypothetical protein K1X11_013450 [Opitutus sp. WL0086]